MTDPILDDAPPAPDGTHGGNGTAPDPAAARRAQRLMVGLADISSRVRRGGVDGERVLFLIGAVALALGLFVIGIGWYGVSGTGLVFEQIPYLVSGGVLGLALVVVGCTLYGCWWVTRAIRERREQHEQLVQKQDEVLAAMNRVADELALLRERMRGR